MLLAFAVDAGAAPGPAAAHRPTTMVRPPATSRQTQQRTAIRDALHEAGRPLSPQEVLAAAQRRSPRLGLATVYRNLRRLEGEGAVIAVEVPGEGSRFELVGKRHHHHFHCRECGRTYDLESEPAACPDGFAAPRGFSVASHELFLFGTCARCNG